MFKNILRGIFTIVGLIIGYIVANTVMYIDSFKNIEFFAKPIGAVSFSITIIILFGLILFLISPMMYTLLFNLVEYVGKNMQKFTVMEIAYGGVGVILALIVTSLAGMPLNKIEFYGLGPILFILINIFAAIIAADLCIKKKDEISSFLVAIKKPAQKEKKGKGYSQPTAKVLDTSVIIDGRIFDLCQTGFIEGPLVIPNFVLDELRHISDSSDSLKRNRGRRGLDVLNKIQKELPIDTQIWEGDFPEVPEVDSKLLKLAQKLNGKVITNDFNLNKVAEFQGVPVLNINELANAIKPVVLPGEEMKVIVVKEGKENTQGIAYLDDGTMIVVEGGDKYMGEELVVIVTSVLQTAAGRMIFAKTKEIQ